jgi:CheY-like chemotaxis protein
MPRGGRITIETANVTLDGEYASRHADVSPGEYARLSVTDTGSGIPEEIRDKIFDPFFTTKEAGRGTGLGLSTCHGIVKQAGGHIGLYSEIGLGTTMKVYLPAVREAATTPAAHVAEQPTTGHERILLVEDDSALRALTARMLSTQGYQVLRAAGATEALRLLEQHDAIDLLVTDMVLPEMSGKEVAERVKRLRPGIKVLYVSGYPGDVALGRFEPDEDAHFLQKPFTIKSLGAKVREVLESR